MNPSNLGPHDEWREQLKDYYAAKRPEYEGKYGIDRRVHIHTAHFSPRSQPEVFREGWIRSSLGRNYLRSLVQRGQDRTVGLLMSRISRGTPINQVLDCGAGLGASSFMLAERFRAMVDALTISPEQGKFISEASKDLGLEKRVTPIITDVFDEGWIPVSIKYDCIIGIDSFCQMGFYDTLFKILASTQAPGGVLAISNYFSTTTGKSLARYFNDYWVSRISPLDDMLTALQHAGYEISALEDTSAQQLPYWNMSMALNALELPGWSASRRSESSAFHRAMRDGFSRGDIKYYQMIARKQA